MDKETQLNIFTEAEKKKPENITTEYGEPEIEVEHVPTKEEEELALEMTSGEKAKKIITKKDDLQEKKKAEKARKKFHKQYDEERLF